MDRVAHVYYVEKDIDRIVTYCERCYCCSSKYFCAFVGEDLLIDDEIIHV